MLLRTTASRIVLALALASSSSLLAGCMTTRESLHAQSTVVGEGVYVRVKDAHVRGEHVVVKTWMRNQSNRTIVVHRDEMTLRLPDGRTVEAPGNRASKPIVIRPGQARNVKVAFRAPRDTDVSAAHLVLGGVQVRGERAPRTLGEIALATDHAMLPIHRSLASAGDRVEAAPEPAEDVSSDEQDPADDEGEGESDSPELEPEEPAETGWQVGGG